MNATALHNQAMQHAQEALVAKMIGDEALAASANVKAYEFEKEAAFSLVDDYDNEPIRSILFHSAAVLAFECNNYREAEKLASQALAGDPQSDLAEDIRNLLEDINFYRHLELSGIALSSSEMQVSLSGNQVAYGLVSSGEFTNRTQTIETLTYRTAERVKKMPYRVGGQVDSRIKNSFQQFLSVPRAASFAVSIRLGKNTDPDQLELFDNEMVTEVIEQVFEGIKLINEGKEDELSELIGDKDYYDNFLSLTKVLAPDGDHISQVGLTVYRNGNLERFGFTRRKKDFFKGNKGEGEKGSDIQVIKGSLRMADADKSKIRIVPDVGQEITVAVPEGLSDIVKMYWEESVNATIEKKKNRYKLIDIEKV